MNGWAPKVMTMQLTPSELLELYVATHQEFYGSQPTKVFMDNMALTREEMIREIEYFKSVMRFDKENSL